MNSLEQHSKNHEHATCIDFQFHKLKFSQKGSLDFHVTTATVDLCVKHFEEKLYMDTLKAKVLTIIVLNLVRGPSKT